MISAFVYRDNKFASANPAPASFAALRAEPGVLLWIDLSEPTDEEIHGVDVLEIENAVKALWKQGIYAESSMGCTGPVIKFAKHNEEKVKEILQKENYL